MKQAYDKEDKKSSLSLILSFLVKFLFPWSELLKMNALLKKVNGFFKNKFFLDQRKKNNSVIVLTLLATIIPGLLGYLAIMGNKAFFYRIDKVLELYNNKRYSMIVPALKWAFSEKLFVLEFKITAISILGGIIISNFLIYVGNRIIFETKKFKKILIKEGIIKEEDKTSVLFTPIGAFIDVSGSSPKEIQSNDRIWMAMNIEVKDFAQNPDKRSELFFKSAFNLKSRYDYVFPKK
jgi:hypothetical protein